MQIFVPAAVTVDGDLVRVDLRPQPAVCKPRDRLWLDQQALQPANGCACGPAARPEKDAVACCG